MDAAFAMDVGLAHSGSGGDAAEALRVARKKEVAKYQVEVKALVQTVSEDAQDVVARVMPMKIMELNRLYESLAPLHDVIPSIHTEKQWDEVLRLSRQCAGSGCARAATPSAAGSGGDGEGSPDSASKKRKTGGGAVDAKAACLGGPPVPCNALIHKVLETLKVEILTLIHNAATVKMWIQMRIPRIEDGNNFGVGIQEETVAELSRAEDSSFAILESMTKYYVTRGKLVSKLFKYPYVEDYVQSIKELDEKEYLSLKLCALDLRNNYCVLKDIIDKNLEKIREPRGHANPAASMY